jgi:hypothetical protein
VGWGWGCGCGGGRGLRLGIGRQDGCYGDEFRVTGSVHGAVCSVHAAADDGSIVNEDAANGGLIRCEGQLGL